MRTRPLLPALAMPLVMLCAAASAAAAELRTYTPGGRIGDQPPPSVAPATPTPTPTPTPTRPPESGRDAPQAEPRTPPPRRGSSTPPPPPSIARPTPAPVPLPPDIRGATDAFKRDLEQPALDRLRHDRALGRLDPFQERNLMLRQQRLNDLNRDPLGR